MASDRISAQFDGELVAVVNAGSSSLKVSLFLLLGGDPHLALRCVVEGLGTAPKFTAKDPYGGVLGQHAWGAGDTLTHEAGLQYLMDFVRGEFPAATLAGVGHRVVHGGLLHSGPTRVTPAVLADLDTLVPLAPLHQPHNLAPIRLAAGLLADVPQVACFDTAFHHGNPPLAQLMALPYELHEAGVRRYGFHGLSYEFIASRLPEVAPRIAAGKVVVLHLGNGASGCAIAGGRSIASTMGFTALDGLPMGTRCGAVDAGVLLYLMDQRGLDARALEHLLYSESGLLGVSGVSSDMRALLASDEPRARLAVDLFVYRIAREVGSLAAALGGLDALVFTAGIGENAAPVRARVVEACAWLGMALDPAANDRGGAGCITTATSRCSAWVIPTDEELMIARHTVEVLTSARPETLA